MLLYFMEVWGAAGALEWGSENSGYSYFVL